MTKVAAWAMTAALAAAATAWAHEPVTKARTEVRIPDPPGLMTLACDFHMHTVFSDGAVWPSIRAEEAWREGLDAIAITDHIEHQPHKQDVSTNLNRSFEIARDAGGGLDVLVIHGSEITRQMPPGHLNALFLSDSSKLAVPDWTSAVAAARAQDAFIFWNHPGWDAQLKDGKVQWFDEHTALLGQGSLHGIEVVNGRDYYPEAHRWAVEKKLTMMSNSDIHVPTSFEYLLRDADHRPLTLVFASARSAEAIREALFARRTAVYTGDRLIGDEAFLRPIFEKSLALSKTNLALRGTQGTNVQIANASEIDYRLERMEESADLSAPKELVLAGGRTVLFSVKGRAKAASGLRKVSLPYRVTNLLVGPDQPLEVRLDFTVDFTPTK